MTVSTLSPDELSFVCTLVRNKSAIELDASKAYLIDARLAPLARQHGFSTLSELVKSVQTRRQSPLESSLIEAMTTNETSFFRDLHPFEALQKQILPELRTRLCAKRELTIWSAACSTGQELYSVAMLLREHFPDLISWKLNLFGTDLSDEVLERARAARYSQLEVNRGLSASQLVKYFQREGMHWQLQPQLRGMATFQKLNLIESWPSLPTVDIVFLRNVLIYFSPGVKKQILRKVRQVMAPHGVLFLGAAETTLNLDSAFERVQLGGSVHYRIK